MSSSRTAGYRRGLAVAIFPFAWLAALYLEFAGVFGPAVAFGVGIGCYAIALWIRRTACTACGRPFFVPFPFAKVARCGRCRQKDEARNQASQVAYASLGFVCVMLVILLGSLAADMQTIMTSATWDAIGAGSDVGAPPCATSDQYVGNGRDSVAVVRQTYCRGAWGAAQKFVFVHRRGEPSSRSNLVLRYDPGDNNRAPHVRWITPSHLGISTGPLLQVTAERPSIDGILVSFKLGKSTFKPALRWWQRIVL